MKKEKWIQFIFAWYDFWIGLYWDRKKKYLYIFPVPMFGVVIKLNLSWIKDLDNFGTNN